MVKTTSKSFHRYLKLQQTIYQFAHRIAQLKFDII